MKISVNINVGILWRSNPSLPITCYELQTVTYGTASAPYLATRCLKEIVELHKDDSELSKVVTSHFYMDDLMTGHDSVEQAHLNWPDMLNHLLLVDNRSHVTVEELTFQGRKDLVNNYPIIVARHFIKRVNELNMRIPKSEPILGACVEDF